MKLNYLTLTKRKLWRRYSTCPFADGETETQKDHTASQRQRQDSTPGHRTPESMLFTMTRTCTILVHYMFFRKEFVWVNPYIGSCTCLTNLCALPIPKKGPTVMGMFNVLEQMWVSRWLLDISEIPFS